MKFLLPRAILALVLWLVAFAIAPYAHTLVYPFVWDDRVFIERNPSIRQIQPIGRFFTDKETLSSKAEYQEKIYRPLRTLTYATLYAGFGLDPFPYRLTNILLHAGCTVLLFALALSLGLAHRSAFVAALLFAVHPVHTEAVTWVSSLGDVLSTALYLSALVLFLRPKTTPKFLAVLLLFPLALLAKEMAITLPALLSIAWWRNLAGSRGESAKRSLAAIATAFAVAALYLFWRSHVLGAMAQMGNRTETFAEIPIVLVEYIKMLIWPYPLNAFRPAIDAPSWMSPSAIIAVTVCAIVAYVSVRLWREDRILGFLGVAFIISLAPVSQIFPIVIQVAERFVYLPSVFFCLLIGFGFQALRRRWTGRLRMEAAFAIVACSATVVCFDRNRVWESDLRLAWDSVRRSHVDSNAYWNLGSAGLRSGDWKTTIYGYTKLLEREKPYPSLLNNLCLAHLSARQPDLAAQYCRQSVEIAPDNWVTWSNLGAALLELGRKDEAVNALRRAVALQPDSYDAHLNLGIGYLNAGRGHEARKAFEEARAIRPDSKGLDKWLRYADRLSAKRP